MFRNNTHRTAWLGIVIAATLFAHAPEARAADTPAPIQAAYGAMDKALNQRNADAYAKWYIPGGIALFGGSKNHIPLSAAMQGERATTSHSQSVDSRTIIQTADIQPDGVTVTIKRTISITRISPGTAILQNDVVHVHVREHWTNSGGKWQINRMRLLDYSEMVDGKTMKMGA